jgi:hypothetical protein
LFVPDEVSREKAWGGTFAQLSVTLKEMILVDENTAKTKMGG